ncbi:hypothetical protein LTR08_008899 [Meristemomyces frigidus]|nr:hypothetical protein LTR08_008899 [Meristemomyces frigidus]
MDGTKREASGVPKPPSDFPDLCYTPPWRPPLDLHEESAIRTTLLPVDQRTIDPRILHGPRASTADKYAHLKPRDLDLTLDVEPPARVRRQIGRRAVRFTASVNRNEDDDGNDDAVLCVDTDNGNDSVYHINANGDSWSGTLESEDDPKVRNTFDISVALALAHLKKAQQLAGDHANLFQAAGDQHEAPRLNDWTGETVDACEQPSYRSDLSVTTQAEYEAEKLRSNLQWNKDLLLRNIVRKLKMKLSNGAVMTVERLSFVDIIITCAHPHCPAPERRIPPEVYYVVIGHPRELESAARFCLSCLESLWNGRGMSGPLPSPEVALHKGATQLMISSLNLDGAKSDGVIPSISLAYPTVSALSLDGTADTEVIPYPFRKKREIPSLDLDRALDDEHLETAGGEKDRHVTATGTSLRSPAAETPATEMGSSSLPGARITTATDEGGPRMHMPSLAPATTQVKASASREARDLGTGFSEAFLDEQAKIARERGNFVGMTNGSNTRRSNRFRIAAYEGSEAASLTTATHVQPNKTSATKDGKVTSADTIAEEVEKGKRRLDEMYKQRQIALDYLEPGQSAVVRNPKGPRSAKYHVSLDEFGIPYTDLLAEPATRYWTQGSEQANGSLATETRSTIAGPMPDELRSPAFVKKRSTKISDHWCTCHGIDDGTEMIRCDNEKCLIGWYHVECVGDEAELDGGANDDIRSCAASASEDTEIMSWTCELCKTYSQAVIKAMPPMSVSPEQVEAIFAPYYAALANVGADGVYGLGSLANPSLPRMSASNQRDGRFTAPQLNGSSYSPKLPVDTARERQRCQAALPQLDGPSDHAPSQNPSRQQHGTTSAHFNRFGIPASLMASKHAPPLEELEQLFAHTANSPYARTPMPETPGGAHTPNSTTSTGEWRQPPTRLQHLAKYFRIGSSLDGEEKATVKVWKEASKEQIHWLEHLARAQKLRNGEDDMLEHRLWHMADEVEHVNPDSAVPGNNTAGDMGGERIDDARVIDKDATTGLADHGEEEEDLEASESKAGILKKDCRGKDLTAALEDARSHRAWSVMVDFT